MPKPRLRLLRLKSFPCGENLDSYERAIVKARYDLLKEYKQGLLVDAEVDKEIELYEEIEGAGTSTSVPESTLTHCEAPDVEPPAQANPAIEPPVQKFFFYFFITFVIFRLNIIFFINEDSKFFFNISYPRKQLRVTSLSHFLSSNHLRNLLRSQPNLPPRRERR